MPKVLLDQNVPAPLRTRLGPVLDRAETVYRMGWATLSNGELLAAAVKEEFDVLVTCDQNIQHQQVIAGRQIAVVVLNTNRWITIREQTAAIITAIHDAKPGSVTVVDLVSSGPPSGRGDFPEPC